ncbi:MAG: rhomboid family intramembrane serine protease [Gammaproteobacteria bacterium]
MFPIRDDNPHFLTPYATFGLIAANVAAWILLQGLGTEPAFSASVFGLGLVPADASWHSVLTSMFMHGGWLHLIGNMWFLWIFGNNVEDVMGHVRFIVFYLLCGVAAALAQVVANPASPVPMVGASGAIGGVMGAYVLLYPRVHVHLLVVLGFYVTTFAVPAVFMLGYWFLLQLVSGWATMGAKGGVAFWAHAGGFIAGGILVFLFRNRRLLARHPFWGWTRRELPTKSWHRVRR